VLLAMLGRAEDARAVCASAVARMAELGQYPHAAGPGWEVERLAGDYVAAESAARRQWELNTTAGFPIFWAAFEVADSLYLQGRYAEAEAAFSLGSDIARDSVDVMFIHKLRAKLLARKGEHDRARQLAEEAVSIAERTDMLDAHAEALSDLAEVLELAGSPDQAAQSLAGALVLYEHKGNIAMVQRTRTRLCQGQIASRSTKPT
jgi:tetratricopeptide (TPR) repeat protein